MSALVDNTLCNKVQTVDPKAVLEFINQNHGPVGPEQDSGQMFQCSIHSRRHLSIRNPFLDSLFFDLEKWNVLKGAFFDSPYRNVLNLGEDIQKARADLLEPFRGIFISERELGPC